MHSGKTSASSLHQVTSSTGTPPFSLSYSGSIAGVHVGQPHHGAMHRIGVGGIAGARPTHLLDQQEVAGLQRQHAWREAPGAEFVSFARTQASRSVADVAPRGRQQSRLPQV